jgi:ArsR family transcriptional regulator
MELRDMRYALRALSDTARLRIIQYLGGNDNEITVSELTQALRISQPLVSWHLRKLRRAQLISTRRVGRQVFLSLNRARLSDCLQSLSVWCDRRVATIRPSGSSTAAQTAEGSPLHRGAGV